MSGWVWTPKPDTPLQDSIKRNLYLINYNRMRTQWTTKWNRDAGSSCSCDRGLHWYLRNFGGWGGLWTPQTTPSVRHWCIWILNSSMLAHDLSQAVSCWPLGWCPLRMGLFGQMGHWDRFIVDRGTLRQGFLRKLLRLSPLTILILHNDFSVYVIRTNKMHSFYINVLI